MTLQQPQWLEWCFSLFLSPKPNWLLSGAKRELTDSHARHRQWVLSVLQTYKKAAKTAHERPERLWRYRVSLWSCLKAGLGAQKQSAGSHHLVSPTDMGLRERKMRAP